MVSFVRHVGELALRHSCSPNTAVYRPTMGVSANFGVGLVSGILLFRSICELNVTLGGDYLGTLIEFTLRSLAETPHEYKATNLRGEGGSQRSTSCRGGEVITIK